MQNALPSQVVNWAIEQKCVKKLEEQMDMLGIPFRVYEVQARVQGDDGTNVNNQVDIIGWYVFQKG